MKKVRWGIAGPGAIANKFAAAIKNVECAQLVAVASRTEENARAFAQKYDIPNTFCGYESMAASDTVDAVYIATPHSFHRQCAEIFLNAKKHVLCEKPVCINTYQAEMLKKCAEENGVFLMEAMWTKFLPAVREAVSVAKSGKIGQIRGLSADFCYSIAPKEDPKVFDNKMAGGSLLDVGVYGLHFASLFFENEPEQILAQADVKAGVDCHTNIILKYPTGEMASISSGINVLKPESAYIYGTKGYVYLPAFYGAQELFIKTNVQKHIEKPSIGEGFEEEIYEACECISQGKLQSDIHPMADSIKILRQMDYIRKQTGVAYPLEGEVR